MTVSLTTRLPFNLSSVIVSSLEWREQAACKNTTTSNFYPEKDEITHAKKVCEQCPVKQQCLDFAIKNHEVHGIWGGMGYRSRLRYMKQLKQTRPPV
jgi:WhiB family redox-sensing transcriptional regulator